MLAMVWGSNQGDGGTASSGRAGVPLPPARGFERVGGKPAESSARGRGQALAEFALVIPVLFFVVAGIIQFGLIFWSQQTLTQVARDTGRWAATQTSCSMEAAVEATANGIAANSTLFGYSSWGPSDVTVTWVSDPPGADPGLTDCPPEDNQSVYFVRVRIDHTIPIFFPFVPGSGNLSTSAEFRMEPEPV